MVNSETKVGKSYMDSEEVPYYDSPEFNSKKLPIKEAFDFPKYSLDRIVLQRS